jgi:hypothetical protein
MGGPNISLVIISWCHKNIIFSTFRLNLTLRVEVSLFVLSPRLRLGRQLGETQKDLLL